MLAKVVQALVGAMPPASRPRHNVANHYNTELVTLYSITAELKAAKSVTV